MTQKKKPTRLTSWMPKNMSEKTAERYITFATLFALFFSVLHIVLISIGMLGARSWVDAVAFGLLSYGISRRSTVSALLVFVMYSMSQIIPFSEIIETGAYWKLIVPVIIIQTLFMGVMGTITYKHYRKPKKGEKNKDKSIFSPLMSRINNKIDSTRLSPLMPRNMSEKVAKRYVMIAFLVALFLSLMSIYRILFETAESFNWFIVCIFLVLAYGISRYNTISAVLTLLLYGIPHLLTLVYAIETGYYWTLVFPTIMTIALFMGVIGTIGYKRHLKKIAKWPTNVAIVLIVVILLALVIWTR